MGVQTSFQMDARLTCERAALVIASCPIDGVHRDMTAWINGAVPYRGVVFANLNAQTSLAELHLDPFGHKLFEAVTEFATTPH